MAQFFENLGLKLVFEHFAQAFKPAALYLIQNNILAPEDAYSEVFHNIPQSGNCWCFDTKQESPKGPAQNLYGQSLKAC